MNEWLAYVPICLFCLLQWCIIVHCTKPSQTQWVKSSKFCLTFDSVSVQEVWFQNISTKPNMTANILLSSLPILGRCGGVGRNPSFFCFCHNFFFWDKSCFYTFLLMQFLFFCNTKPFFPEKGLFLTLFFKQILFFCK